MENKGLKVIPGLTGRSIVQVPERRFFSLPIMAQKWFLTFARLRKDLFVHSSQEGKILTFEIADEKLEEFFENLKKE
jgi:hypothetical protein